FQVFVFVVFLDAHPSLGNGLGAVFGQKNPAEAGQVVTTDRTGGTPVLSYRFNERAIDQVPYGVGPTVSLIAPVIALLRAPAARQGVRLRPTLLGRAKNQPRLRPSSLILSGLASDMGQEPAGTPRKMGSMIEVGRRSLQIKRLTDSRNFLV
ncbi:hypothetical protein, partial [Rhizobium sp. Nf11,1]|uniref:hypothetical protein n=1 Tax=Rhizobium sp. Nf11,1 TaxID=3404923 RepID=UPI003D339409